MIPKSPKVARVFILMIYLMYWIYLLSFIYVIHVMCWNYLIDLMGLMDLITHNRNRNNSIHCNNKGARARSARALYGFRPRCCFCCFCFCCV